MTRNQTLFAILLSVAAIFGVAFSHGDGHTLHQIQNAGWHCELAIGLEHCTREPLESLVADGAASISVMVYDPDTHEFVVTESLIRQDLYKGQPCPQEGLDEWTLLPFGYYACHHGSLH